MEYRKTARKNPVTVSFSSNLVKRRGERAVYCGLKNQTSAKGGEDGRSTVGSKIKLSQKARAVCWQLLWAQKKIKKTQKKKKKKKQKNSNLAKRRLMKQNHEQNHKQNHRYCVYLGSLKECSCSDWSGLFRLFRAIQG